jgi:hypothetical protein
VRNYVSAALRNYVSGKRLKLGNYLSADTGQGQVTTGNREAAQVDRQLTVARSRSSSGIG